MGGMLTSAAACCGGSRQWQGSSSSNSSGKPTLVSQSAVIGQCCLDSEGASVTEVDGQVTNTDGRLQEGQEVGNCFYSVTPW